MGHTYFSSDFFSFFEELAHNNHKDWFDANRKRYEKEVKNPSKALVEDLLTDLAKLDADFMPQKPSQILFRINRDIRFSKDKTPYKTHVAAYFCPLGKKKEYPGYYFSFGYGADNPQHGGGWHGCGLYELSTEGLQAVRELIAHDLDAFHAVIHEPNFAETFGVIQGAQNKVLPKEFKVDAEREPLLYNKQFFAGGPLDKHLLVSDTLKETLLNHYEVAMPLMRYFGQALKPLAA